MKISSKEIKKIIDEEFIKVAREVRRLTEREAAQALKTLEEGWDHTDPAMGIEKAKAGLEEIRMRLEGMASGQDISPERVLGMVDEVALRLDLALKALPQGEPA